MNLLQVIWISLLLLLLTTMLMVMILLPPFLMLSCLAEEWNQLMEQENTVVVDVRNRYESEVGYFENAIRPEVYTFRESLPVIENVLKDKSHSTILMYCTGGIRCEKASAFLYSKGFTNIRQLKGGIITYAAQVKSRGLPCKFKGKNFVFDSRMGERVTEDVLGRCTICGVAADHHVNCANNACDKLFIQCANCSTSMNGACSLECKNILHEESVYKTVRSLGSTTTHQQRVQVG